MQNIRFGTDGWRGVISDNFTFENVRKVAGAIADYYKENSYPPFRIAIGFDTRFLSSTYARLVAEILSNRGIEVLLSPSFVPTPALSFITRKLSLTCGIMITASHNPCEYNGIKIKTQQGGAAGIQITQQIEKKLKEIGITKSRVKPATINMMNFISDYIRFLRSYLNLDILKNKRYKVLVDAMHGSGNSFIKDILNDTKIQLDFIRNEVNPGFGGLRPEPVLENLLPSIQKLKEKKYDLGIVLDGDADRIAAFLGDAEFLHPQKILGLLILHLTRNRRLKGGVIKTIVGTNLIDKITKKLGLKLYETPVGFKYISEIMQKEDILIGGEEAGGIGFKDYIPERDGTLAGLLLIEMMAYENKSMAEILKNMEDEFGRYFYLREDLKLNKPVSQNLYQRFKKTKNILGEKVIEVKDYDGVKLICEDESWVMARLSGTEPLIRFYAEAKDADKAHRLIKFAKKCFTIF
ncbi:MAG: phosphoglucomutase/phosphomannomutase family protein [Candidatus Omnitrophica bacterium]|nr:phosphoglucomutase/phosphomannomutase family protein [Candidatus Omnitrophota bacterium]